MSRDSSSSFVIDGDDEGDDALESTRADETVSLHSLIKTLPSWNKLEVRGRLLSQMKGFVKAESKLQQQEQQTAGTEEGDKSKEGKKKKKRNNTNDLPLRFDHHDHDDGAPDDPSVVISVAHSCATSDVDVFTYMCHVLLLVLRRKKNEAAIVKVENSPLLRDVSKLLALAVTYQYSDAAAHIIRVILMLCSSLWGHVIHFLDSVQNLVACLRMRDETVVCLAASTLQFLSATSIGKQLLTQPSSKGVRTLAALLYSSKGKVVARCISALHSATADLDVAHELAHDCAAIPVVVTIIRDITRSGSLVALQNPRSVTEADEAVLVDCCGTLQNVCRVKDCVALVVSAGGIDALTPLVFHANKRIVAAAMGAVLNLCGDMSTDADAAAVAGAIGADSNSDAAEQEENDADGVATSQRKENADDHPAPSCREVLKKAVRATMLVTMVEDILVDLPNNVSSL